MKIEDLGGDKEYWKRPNPSPKGDEHSDAIYLAVGRALTKWEVLEQYFASIFKHLIESESDAALRAYGSIASARGRRDCLLAAGAMFFYIHNAAEEHPRRFRKLIEHFASASTRRNEFAHGTLTSVTKRGCFLMPPDYNTQKTDLPKHSVSTDLMALVDSLGSHYRYTSKNIDHFKDKFTSLGNVAADYLEELRKIPRRPIAPML